MRLDILYFLGYDIDEELPWHSTISRTRQLFPEEVFERVFAHVFGMCVGQGMAKGSTQAIDSAPVKANASMDSLELKVPERELEAHLADIRHISKRDKGAYRRAKENKARKLNYSGQLSVDTAHHVISDVGSYHADGKDSQYLRDIVDCLSQRLWQSGLQLENVLADTGFSSGENYAYLERKGIKSYIPPHGTYKGGPDGFTYIKEQDHYIFPRGEVIPFKKVFNDYRMGTKKKEYRISSKICRECPLASSCLGKSAKEKKFSVTYYRDEYERNIARLKTGKGKRMKAKRQATVEPVLGTLTQFMGLGKINTIGIRQANKVMHLSAMAYNLKKYLKFMEKRVKNGAGAATSIQTVKNTLVDCMGLKINLFFLTIKTVLK